MSNPGSMGDVIFADTVASISASAGVVKLNLVRTEEPTKEGEEARVVPAGRLVIPLPGFLYAVSIVEGFVNKEEFQKLIKSYQEAGMLPSSDGDAES